MLRTGAATAALVACCLLEAVVFLAHGTPWRGEWNWTLDFAVGCSVLTGPVVASLAAWLASVDRRRAVLNDSAPRGWQVPGRAAVAACAVGLAAFVAGAVAALVATLTVPHGGTFSAWVLVLAPLLLFFYASLGAAVGHHCPYLVVVALVAPASFLLGNLGVLGIGPNVLRQGPSTGSLAGLAWDPVVVLAQGAVLAGAACMLVLVQGILARVARAGLIAASMATVALTMGGLVALGSHGDESFVVSAERATACSRTEPRVCVAPSNRRALAAVSRSLGAAARVLTAAGANVPGTYLQELPGEAGRSGAGVFALPAEANVTTYSRFQAAHAITVPEPCSAWYGDRPPAPAVFEARELISAWILRVSGDGEPAFSTEGDDWLRHTTPSIQRAWVRDTYDHLRECALDEIRPPWPSVG